MRTFRTTAELLAHERPDFVIVSVPWPVTPEATRELVAAGVPVLAETPPAPDLAGLRSLWADVGGSGLVQVAEQYLLMPGHAARLAVVRAGVLGEPTSVQISSTHLYHAVSLIRGLLGVGHESAEVSARVRRAAGQPALAGRLERRRHPAAASHHPRDHRLRRADGVVRLHRQPVVEPAAYRRLVVRGSRGELVDDRVVRLVDPTTPVESSLVRRQTGLDLNLEGLDLKHISFDGDVVYRNPFVGSGMSDDDIAVADIVARAGAWAREEGPAPYSLAEACQDHLISLAIEESVRTGRPVVTATEAWGR